MLRHDAYAFAEHRVNAPAAPVITHIEVSSAVPDAGFHSFENRDKIVFSVTFSAPVILSGSGAASLKVLVGRRRD